MVLKKIRRIISILVLSVFLVVFIGTSDFTATLSTVLVFFQFTPSLVKFLLVATGLASTGFLLVMILTLLMGRVFCAGLCPLGVLQDISIFIFRKTNRKKKRKFSYNPAYNKTRFLFLFSTILCATLGSFSLLNLLDPYSIFGRLVSNLLKPLLYSTGNLSVSVFEYFDYYEIQPMDLPETSNLILCVCGVYFLILILISFFHGRLFCNLICPVGTLLSLIAKISIFQLTINQNTCISCNQCMQNCKAECISNQGRTISIDYGRCIMCFNCMDTCAVSAIQLRNVYKGNLQNISDMIRPPLFEISRRKLLLNSVTIGTALTGLSIPARSTVRPALSKFSPLPISPPGSISIAHFNETCTACHLCVSVCETQALKPAWMEYGWKGVLQPVMDFNHGNCHYECNACGQVCPTGAILPLKPEEKKRVQIGTARLFEEKCVVVKNDSTCGLCAKACPTHAIQMIEEFDVFYPTLNTTPCIGCGACQFACPTDPKAIMVVSNAVHQILTPASTHE